MILRIATTTTTTEVDLKFIDHALIYFKKNEMIDTIVDRPRRLGGGNVPGGTLRLNCLYDEEPSLVNLLYYKYHNEPNYSFINNRKLIFDFFVDIFVDSHQQQIFKAATVDDIFSQDFLSILKGNMVACWTQTQQNKPHGGGFKKTRTKIKDKKYYTKKYKNKSKGRTFKKRNITKSQKKRRPKFPV